MGDTMKKLTAIILTVFMILSSSSTYAAHVESDGSDKGTSNVQQQSTLTDEELASSALPIVQSYKTDGSQQWTMDESTRFIIPNTDKHIENSRLTEVVKLVSAEFLDK